MNFFSQENDGELEPHPILARAGEHLNDLRLAAFVVNCDPQTGDRSLPLDCGARAWHTLKFSAGHPETGKHPPRLHFELAITPAPLARQPPGKTYADE